MAHTFAASRFLASSLNHRSSLLSEQLMGEMECLTLGVSSLVFLWFSNKYVKTFVWKKKKKGIMLVPVRGADREALPCFSPAFRCLPGILDVPWLVATSFLSLSHLHRAFFHLCLSLPLLIRTTATLDQGSPALQDDSIFTYIFMMSTLT